MASKSLRGLSRGSNSSSGNVIVDGLKRDGIPLTLDTYMTRNWGKGKTDLDAEEVSALPE